MKRDYQNAMAYAKSGKYSEALKLLKPYKGKNPKVDALIAKLQKRIKRPLWQRIAMYAIVTVVTCSAIYGVIWLAVNWNWYFSGGREDFQKHWTAVQICNHIEVVADVENCDDEKLVTIYSREVNYCYEQLGELSGSRQETEKWIECLDKEGVFFPLLVG